MLAQPMCTRMNCTDLCVGLLMLAVLVFASLLLSFLSKFLFCKYVCSLSCLVVAPEYHVCSTITTAPQSSVRRSEGRRQGRFVELGQAKLGMAPVLHGDGAGAACSRTEEDVVEVLGDAGMCC